jgi:hypothetical protein
MMSATFKPAGSVATRSPVGFPPPRFPSGVSVPPLTMLVALLLSAAGLAAIRTVEPLVVLGGPQGRPGVIPSVLLAMLAVWAWLVLRWAIVLPVRELRRLSSGP